MSVQVELKGRPPVHACLNKVVYIYGVLSNTLVYYFVIIWLFYFILGKLSNFRVMKCYSQVHPFPFKKSTETHIGHDLFVSLQLM